MLTINLMVPLKLRMRRSSMRSFDERVTWFGNKHDWLKNYKNMKKNILIIKQ